MKNIIAFIAAICFFSSSTLAFAPSTPRAVVSTRTPTSLGVFGNRKTEAQKAEEAERAAKYWQGEWVRNHVNVPDNFIKKILKGTHNLVLIFSRCAKTVDTFTIGPSVQACISRSKDPDSGVPSAQVLEGGMPRRLGIVLEQLWMVVMRQFSYFRLVDLLLQLRSVFGLCRTCNNR